MAQAVFRIYVDDSGEKEYGSKTSRYFAYAGVVVDRAVEEAISAEIDRLKTGTFGTAQVEIKSNWIRIASERKRRYLEPFKISDQDLNAFPLDKHIVDNRL